MMQTIDTAYTAHPSKKKHPTRKEKALVPPEFVTGGSAANKICKFMVICYAPILYSKKRINARSNKPIVSFL